MNRLPFACAVLLLLLHAPLAAAASLQSCRAIADDRARLACYDSLAVPPASTPAPAAPTPLPALTRRLENQQAAEHNRFAIVPYKPNYILPLTYTPNRLDNPAYGFRPEHSEVKFQISLQFDMLSGLLGRGTDLYAAYSQLSFWQAYNGAASSPFRETNYEPELGVGYRPQDLRIFGLDIPLLRLGFVHQSNGQGGLRSRSWNRIVATTAFQRGNFAGALRVWKRIRLTSQDDNPDITHYLGYGSLVLAYKLHDQTFALTLHDNLRWHANRGAVQLDYSFPLTHRLKGYVQYFNGYGESLIDYNRSINRLGVGIMLTDWL